MITEGRHSYTGQNVEVIQPEVEIGNFTSISSQVHFFGITEHPPIFNRQAVSNFPFCELNWGEYPRGGSRGKIVIGSDVWIGEHAFLLGGVHIGDGAIVGAAAVVTKDVPPYAVVVGNPGRVIKYRFAEEQIEKLLEIKWWDWDDQKIRQMLPLMSDIDKFLLNV